ncbi:MAG TPA: U32 family peptidase C-terminal domain-containing protein [Patescibacteria group bacterium]
MPKNKEKIELLAPAGSLEKLKYAIHYGADAVYAGIPDVSMRARINAFDEKALLEAIEYVHTEGKKIFVTLNIYAHNYHLPTVEKHLKFLKKTKVDALIISDPGIISLAKKIAPEIPIHLSTQANTTNWQAAKFWYELGVERIVLAREVTLDDIRQIKKHVPKLELEYFVHGAMCMSYSGRCILSKWMSGKSANLGDCTQPCRWGYHQKSKVESRKLKDEEDDILTMSAEEVQGRHGLELEQDKHGTYFFNSKDLNLLSHLKELKDAGVTSFKIEGRNKSAFYVASVVRAYRSVLDVIEAGKDEKELKKVQRAASGELDKLVNRGYTKGFLLGLEPEHSFYGSPAINAYQFVGEVLARDGKKLTMKIHNAVYTDDVLEMVSKEKIQNVRIKKILNENGEEVESAHGGHDKLYYIEVDKKDIEPYSLMRKIVG